MAGTEAKKIAPATADRASLITTLRRFLPAGASRRHHGGCWQVTPAARWRLFYLMELTLSPDDTRQSSHWRSLSCRPHKFSVNLTLKASFRQGTLGRLKRNFLIRLGTPGPWRRPLRGTAEVAKHCCGHALRFCLKSDAGAPIEAALPPYARTRRALRALQRQQ